MRCIALAEAARHKDIEVAFLSRDAYTDGLLIDHGEKIVQANYSAKWIIRDFRDGSPIDDVVAEVAAGSRVLLLDEAGPARVKATLVSDCLMTDTRRHGFPHSDHSQYLYGLQYAPLRQEFSVPIKPVGDNRLLICLGGGDMTATTQTYVEALHNQGFRGPATIVSGGDKSCMHHIEEIISSWQQSELLSDSRTMVQLISDSSLVVTKLGMMQLESYACGRPCLLIEPSEAHLILNKQLAEQYSDWPAVELGLASEADYLAAAKTTLTLFEGKGALIKMARRAANLVDGRGSQRLINELLA